MSNMEDINQYTITLFSENYAGVLNRITSIFSRRKINLDSIISSQSEVEGIFRHIMVVRTTEKQVEKLVKQIEKQIEVLKALYYIKEEIVHRELALYKLKNDESFHHDVNKIIATHDAKIININKDYFVIEKTGYKKDTQDLFDLLKPYGVLEFARSGRVAVSKPMYHIADYVGQIEATEEYNSKL